MARNICPAWGILLQSKFVQQAEYHMFLNTLMRKLADECSKNEMAHITGCREVQHEIKGHKYNRYYTMNLATRTA
jgi:hypothetical protein